MNWIIINLTDRYEQFDTFKILPLFESKQQLVLKPEIDLTIRRFEWCKYIWSLISTVFTCAEDKFCHHVTITLKYESIAEIKTKHRNEMRLWRMIEVKRNLIKDSTFWKKLSRKKLNNNYNHLLLGVHLGVSLPLVWTCKFPTANVTREWLFTRMSSNMRRQMVTPWKCPHAYATLKTIHSTGNLQ